MLAVRVRMRMPLLVLVMMVVVVVMLMRMELDVVGTLNLLCEGGDRHEDVLLNLHKELL